MIESAIMGHRDQLRMCDTYLLKSTEEVTADGTAIICKDCGGVRYRRAYSPLFKGDRWVMNQRLSRCGTSMLTGCQCEQRARREAARRRDGYVMDDGSDEKGKSKQVAVAGTHTDVIYNANRYLFSVPEAYRKKWIESSSFWTLKGESQFSYQMVRTLMDSVFFDNEIMSGVFLYGGEKAVMLMCAVRNAMLHYGHPCIFMDSRTFLFHMTNNTPMAEEMKNVEVLILSFSEPNSPAADKIMYELLKDRNLSNTKKTFFCTKVDSEEFATKWVGEKVFGEIIASIDGVENMMEVKGESE